MHTHTHTHMHLPPLQDTSLPSLQDTSPPALQDIFRREKLDKLADGLRPYTIQSTSSQTGLVEAMTDAVSVDSVKRRMLKAAKPTSLEYYYRQRFDPAPRGEGGGAAEGGASPEETGNASFEEAQWMCMYSVAAYSLVQYILALKDRHNGNILIDSRGRMVHIDFSYMLGWAPGGITFEKTAFKLTRDIVDVWGGRGSPLWDEFVELIVSGMQAVQAHHQRILRDVEVAPPPPAGPRRPGRRTRPTGASRGRPTRPRCPS